MFEYAVITLLCLFFFFFPPAFAFNISIRHEGKGTKAATDDDEKKRRKNARREREEEKNAVHDNRPSKGFLSKRIE